MLYDVIIIGGGPGGVAATVYAARKNLKTLLITDTFGGQSIDSDDIQNWNGEKSISGVDLAKKLEEHARNFPDTAEIKMSEKVIKISETKCTDHHRACDFSVETDKDNTYNGKAIILAAGARHRKLDVPGEEKLDGKGVAYCSTCDAPLFKGKDVAVVGGGNAGLEAVIDLFPYAYKIYLLQRSDKLSGDPVTQDEINKNEKTEIIFNATTLEVLGDKFVSGLKFKDTVSEEEKELEVGGVFVQIGSVPNSEIVKDLVKLDKYGQVITDAKYGSTSHPGIFATGDITDDPYKQNNISVGDGVRAALSAYLYLLNKKKETPAAG